MTRVSHISSLRESNAAANAKELRKRMTDAEHMIWYRLRAGRFEGRKFRRQVPVGPFVVDFLCESARLVVEIDGGQHDEGAQADARRSRWLERHGYRVVRFWNNDVMENIEGVLEALARSLA